MLKKGIIALLILSVTTITAQKDKKANESFKSLSFKKAIVEYEKLAEKNPTPEVYKKLGDSYFFNNDMVAASKSYSKLFNLFEKNNLNKEYYFRYAQALRGSGQYLLSDKWMQKFNEVSPNDRRGINFVKDKGFLNEILYANFFSIKLLDKINTKGSDFVSGEVNGELIFASPSKKFSNVYSWNEQPFLDLYQVASENKRGAIEFSSDINSKYHESNIALSPDGNTLYFTRNNYKDGKLKKDESGSNNLKIFKATKNKKGKWSNITELPFNGDGFSTGHPAVSKDGKRLYFSSNREGSKGQTDIFYVDILEGDKFGTPVNLGDNVNTEGREMFPYVDVEGDLYFSSDGHFGLGGLDVFVLKDNTPINLGAPLNSNADDFSLVFDNKTKKGFVSSNRDGGIGDDDVYSFKQLKEVVGFGTCLVRGKVKEKNTDKLLADATVTAYDDIGNILKQFTTNENGEFEFELNCNKDYSFTATKELYNKETLQLALTNESAKDELLIALDLNEDFAKSKDGNLIIKINPIYFDYGKASIRKDAAEELDRIVEVMNKYPDIIVLGSSHTDSRGKDSYNLKLSDRRAKSTVAYIISKGISPTRISSRGYGETQLVNDCYNGRKCSNAQHQLNRRTEFVIVGSQKSKKDFADISKKTEERKSTIKYHRVAKEDTLYNISNRYNITVPQLKKMNNLKSNLIVIGQRLIVKE